MIKHFKLFASSICFICVFSIAEAQESAWFDAVKQGDEWALSGLLFKGVDVNTPDGRGNTAMHLVAKEGQVGLLKWLLKQKDTDLNARNAAGETPLMLALINGNWPLATQLLAKGAQVNQTGWTPLHYAAAAKSEQSVVMVRTLVEEHAAYIDAESPNGTTPLMMAAQYGAPAAVGALIEIGADVELKNQLGLTALDFAQRGERPDAVRLISAEIQKIEQARAIARAEEQARAAAKALAEAQAAALAEAKRLAEERAVKAAPVAGSVSGIEVRVLGAPLESAPRPRAPEAALKQAAGEGGQPNASQGVSSDLVAPALQLPPSLRAVEPSAAASADTGADSATPQPESGASEAPQPVDPQAVLPTRMPLVVPESAFGKVIGPAPITSEVGAPNTDATQSAATQSEEATASDTPPASPDTALQTPAGASTSTPAQAHQSDMNRRAAEPPNGPPSAMPASDATTGPSTAATNATLTPATANGAEAINPPPAPTVPESPDATQNNAAPKLDTDASPATPATDLQPAPADHKAMPAALQPADPKPETAQGAAQTAQTAQTAETAGDASPSDEPTASPNASTSPPDDLLKTAKEAVSAPVPPKAVAADPQALITPAPTVPPVLVAPTKPLLNPDTPKPDAPVKTPPDTLKGNW